MQQNKTRLSVYAFAFLLLLPICSFQPTLAIEQRKLLKANAIFDEKPLSIPGNLKPGVDWTGVGKTRNYFVEIPRWMAGTWVTKTLLIKTTTKNLVSGLETVNYIAPTGIEGVYGHLEHDGKIWHCVSCPYFHEINPKQVDVTQSSSIEAISPNEVHSHTLFFTILLNAQTMKILASIPSETMATFRPVDRNHISVESWTRRYVGTRPSSDTNQNFVHERVKNFEPIDSQELKAEFNSFLQQKQQH